MVLMQEKTTTFGKTPCVSVSGEQKSTKSILIPEPLMTAKRIKSIHSMWRRHRRRGEAERSLRWRDGLAGGELLIVCCLHSVRWTSMVKKDSSSVVIVRRDLTFLTLNRSSTRKARASSRWWPNWTEASSWEWCCKEVLVKLCRWR